MISLISFNMNIKFKLLVSNVRDHIEIKLNTYALTELDTYILFKPILE